MSLMKITEEYIEFEQAEESYLSAIILKNGIKNKQDAFYFFA